MAAGTAYGLFSDEFDSTNSSNSLTQTKTSKKTMTRSIIKRTTYGKKMNIESATFIEKNPFIDSLGSSSI